MCYSEGDNKVWYYSSKVQLEELINALDSVHWERDLVRSIVEMRDDVTRQMALIEELTHELKGHKRAVLDSENGSWPHVFLKHSWIVIHFVCVVISICREKSNSSICTVNILVGKTCESIFQTSFRLL